MKFLKIIYNNRILTSIFIFLVMIALLFATINLIYSNRYKSSLLSYYLNPKSSKINKCELDKTFYWREKGKIKLLKFNYMEIKKLSVVSWVFYDCNGKRLATFWPPIIFKKRKYNLKNHKYL